MKRLLILTVFFWNKPLYDTDRVVERYGNVENYTRKITYREDGRRFNCEEYDENGNIIQGQESQHKASKAEDAKPQSEAEPKNSKPKNHNMSLDDF